MIWRRLSQNTFGIWTVLYLTRSYRTQFRVSVSLKTSGGHVEWVRCRIVAPMSHWPTRVSYSLFLQVFISTNNTHVYRSPFYRVSHVKPTVQHTFCTSLIYFSWTDHTIESLSDYIMVQHVRWRNKKRLWGCRSSQKHTDVRCCGKTVDRTKYWSRSLLWQGHGYVVNNEIVCVEIFSNLLIII
jgi:hypothetical protein